MNDTTADGTGVRSAIDREVELVTSAVDLIASGGAPSAMVGGLRLADAVLEIVTPHALAVGVAVEPLWSSDEAVTDVLVRRVPA